MFHVAHPRGRGPALADLPPTLQPCVVAGAAPPTDLRRTVLLTGLVYGSLLAAAFGTSRLGHSVAALPLPPKGETWRPVIITGPPAPAQARVSPPAAPAGPVAVPDPGPAAPPVQAPPDVPGPLLASSDPRPAPQPGGAGPVTPGIGTPTGPANGFPAASGPVVHDFTATGLAVLRQVPPVYPDLARHARIEGPVLLRITVDELGQPTQVEVLKGHVVFHAAALQAARQWRFVPAQMNGHAVAATFQLTLNFRLR